MTSSTRERVTDSAPISFGFGSVRALVDAARTTIAAARAILPSGWAERRQSGRIDGRGHNRAMERSSVDIARDLHAALEAGKSGEELRALFTEDAITIERPNAIKPTGAVTELEGMLKASIVGASLLARQTYSVHSAIAQGTLAILRLTWTGEIARDVGAFAKGQVLTAHIAQFVETRDGRIARIETYDCYEPLTAK